MSRHSIELYMALAAAVLIGIFYLMVAANAVPRSSSPLGHGLGIVGFLLMLAAETLYSWRKQARRRVWGRTSTWLKIHIFIGLLGPYLVLLHSAWRLNGLAGSVMLLTLLMVASGFFCRYIYTAVPHTVDGAELALRDQEAQMADADTLLQEWAVDHPAAVSVLGQGLKALTEPAPAGDAVTVLGHSLLRWGYHRQLRRELRQLQAAGQQQAGELAALLDRRYRLQTQISSLAAARKLLAQSRTIHIVIGAALFALAFVHIGAALYYATFAR